MCPEVEKNKNDYFLGMPGGGNCYNYWIIWIFSEHLQKKSAQKLNPMEFSGLSKSGMALQSTYLIFTEFRQILPLMSEKGQNERAE